MIRVVVEHCPALDGIWLPLVDAVAVRSSMGSDVPFWHIPPDTASCEIDHLNDALSVPFGRWVRVRSGPSEATAPVLFTGMAHHQTTTALGSQRRHTLHLVQQDSIWRQFTISPTAVDSSTADTLIRELWNTLPYPRLAPTNAIVLGTGILGTHLLADSLSTCTCEAGISELWYPGEYFADGAYVYDLLQGIATSDAGHVFIDQHGILQFFNRYHWVGLAPVASFTNPVSATIAPPAPVSRFQVRTYPRRIAASTGVLFTLQRALEVPPGSSISFTTGFTDADGNSCLCRAASHTLANFNYNTRRDGLGSSIPATYTLSMSLSHAKFVFTNSTAVPQYLQPGATISGLAVQRQPAIELLTDSGNPLVDLPNCAELLTPYLQTPDDLQAVSAILFASRNASAPLSELTLDPARHPNTDLAMLRSVIEVRTTASAPFYRYTVTQRTDTLDNGKHRIQLRVQPTLTAPACVLDSPTLALLNSSAIVYY